MSLRYRVPSLRGANQIAANPERIESEDGKRWACGRWVKGEDMKRPGCYRPVQVWSLRRRNADGKVEVVGWGFGRDEADRWVKSGRLT